MKDKEYNLFIGDILLYYLQNHPEYFICSESERLIQKSSICKKDMNIYHFDKNNNEIVNSETMNIFEQELKIGIGLCRVQMLNHHHIEKNYIFAQILQSLFDLSPSPSLIVGQAEMIFSSLLPK